MTSPCPTPAPPEQKDGPTYLEVRENFCPKTPGAATHGGTPAASFFVDKGAPLATVHMNMKARFRLFSRLRRRHPRPRQLKLNLWPNRQTLSGKFWRESATTRNRR